MVSAWILNPVWLLRIQSAPLESKPRRCEVKNKINVGYIIQLNKYNNNKNIVYIILYLFTLQNQSGVFTKGGSVLQQI